MIKLPYEKKKIGFARLEWYNPLIIYSSLYDLFLIYRLKNGAIR